MLCILFLFFASSLSFADVDVNAITGSTLPSNTLSLTYDDGPDEQTYFIGKYLHDQGIRATFFVKGCQLNGSPPPLTDNSGCYSGCDSKKYPISIEAGIVVKQTGKYTDARNSINVTLSPNQF